MKRPRSNPLIVCAGLLLASCVTDPPPVAETGTDTETGDGDGDGDPGDGDGAPGDGDGAPGDGDGAPAAELLEQHDPGSCDVPVWCISDANDPKGSGLASRVGAQVCFESTLTPPLSLSELSVHVGGKLGTLDSAAVEVYERTAQGPGALLVERPLADADLEVGPNVIALDPPLLIESQAFCVGVVGGDEQAGSALGVAVDDGSMLEPMQSYVQAPACGVPNWADVTVIMPTPTASYCISAMVEEGQASVCGDGVITGNEGCDDGNADDTDGCLSTCVPAKICQQILAEVPGATDGVYTIDPDGDGGNAPFEAYCDMTEDGGGWTLAAKVHRWHEGDPYPEPDGWFAQEHDVEALLDTMSYEDRPTGNAAHGEARLGPVLDELSVARVVIVAEDDPMQRASWFKQVDGGAFSWFSTTAHPATPVCEDPELTLNCTSGTIQAGGVTYLQGMSLNDYGYTACPNEAIHMRLDVDVNAFGSSVCSCTQNYDNNAWNDDGLDGHWGNGLEVWLR